MLKSKRKYIQYVDSSQYLKWDCANGSAFTTLFREVCAPFNITVPLIGSNSSANGTMVTYPAPSYSVVPATGVGSMVSRSGWLMLVVAMAALVSAI